MLSTKVTKRRSSSHFRFFTHRDSNQNEKNANDKKDAIQTELTILLRIEENSEKKRASMIDYVR